MAPPTTQTLSQVKYKKGKANTQADALYILLSNSEMIPDQDYEGIPAFFIDAGEVNHRLQTNRG